MPRPPKKREVCCLPQTGIFAPGDSGSKVTIHMSVEEYETIRLIDYEGINQEACAAQMNVSRTTVQGIYLEARKKIADAIVNSRTLVIEGGEYQLCSKQECADCRRRCPKNQYKNAYDWKNKNSEEINMKIAVTYENGQIFQHFGHTSQFKVYEVENKEIKDSKVVDTNGSGHGALAGFLQNLGVDVLICGGIGGGAQNALADAGIQLFGGASGDADANVKALLAEELVYNPNVQCNHHNHEHGDGTHTCGSHGCGNHK